MKQVGDKAPVVIIDGEVVAGPFFLFAYDTYYPGGGLNDYHGAFTTIDDVLQVIKDEENHYEHIELVALVGGELEWIGDINPSGNVHFEPADKVLRQSGERR